jgi:hypothetical protein
VISLRTADRESARDCAFDQDADIQFREKHRHFKSITGQLTLLKDKICSVARAVAPKGASRATALLFAKYGAKLALTDRADSSHLAIEFMDAVKNLASLAAQRGGALVGGAH